MFDSIILQDVGFCYTFIYYYRYSEDAFKLDILISQNSNQYNCYWCVGWLKKYYILYRLNRTENEKLVCNRFICHFFILKYWILLLFSCCLLNPKRVIVVRLTARNKTASKLIEQILVSSKSFEQRMTTLAVLFYSMCYEYHLTSAKWRISRVLVDVG